MFVVTVACAVFLNKCFDLMICQSFTACMLSVEPCQIACASTGLF